MHGRRRVDLLAAAAALLALAMLVVYGAIMGQQGDRPLLWVDLTLCLAAVAAGYGAVVTAPLRRTVLLAAGLVLSGLGLLAILTIGLPILVGAGLCFLAAAREPAAGAP